MSKFKDVLDALAPIFEIGFSRIEQVEITEEPIDISPDHCLNHITIKFNVGYDRRPKVEKNSMYMPKESK
jgi:hypothetical protein